MEKQEILKKIDDINNKALIDDRFSLFMFDTVKEKLKNNDLSVENLSKVYEMLKPWDDKSSIEYKTGKLLNELEQNDNIIVGFHRTKLDLTGNDLKDIVNNGLINYGHINAVGSSALNEIPQLALTMTPLKGIAGIINLTASYHDNNTVIISAFPSKLVDEELYTKKENLTKIYEISDKTQPRVRPEYIIGAILKEEKQDKFYSTNKINDGLISNKNKK